jgi:PilZ domain
MGGPEKLCATRIEEVVTSQLIASPLIQTCLADGSQSSVEQAVFGFFLVLFFVAVALNFSGSRQRLRPVNVENLGAKRRIPMPPKGHSWGAVWARCVWELDILRTYLAEVGGSSAPAQTTVEPSRLSQNQESTAAADRRRWTRHPSNLQAVCWSAGSENPGTWLARVRDISGGGLGLIAPRKLPLGAVLHLQLVAPHLADQKPLKAEVMFMSQNSQDEWILGCEFLTPLTPEQQLLYL